MQRTSATRQMAGDVAARRDGPAAEGPAHARLTALAASLHAAPRVEALQRLAIGLAPPAAPAVVQRVPDRRQIEGMASFLARRTGTTDPAAIRRDVLAWTARTTGGPAPNRNAKRAIAGILPGANRLTEIVDRHRELVQEGRNSADQGSPVGEMRDAITAQVPQGLTARVRRSAERAASAEVMATDYSHASRFTDGTATGNLSYYGKANPEDLNRFRPSAEEDLAGSGTGFAVEAHSHVSGNTQGSRWASVTGDVRSALQTTDPDLQGIMYGSDRGPGAPYIDSFMVPRHGLLRADQAAAKLREAHDNTTYGLNYGRAFRLAESEHEALFRGDTLDDYRIGREANPYRNFAPEGRERLEGPNGPPNQEQEEEEEGLPEWAEGEEDGGEFNWQPPEGEDLLHGGPQSDEEEEKKG